MTVEPLVSIIIPCYNAGEYISETTQSVIDQSYKNWELIIVNDGSTDETEKKVVPFLTDDRVKYFYKPNSGVSDTRNFGAQKSKGEYLCFLDADDRFYAENLEKKVDFLLKHTAVDLVFADVCLIDGNGKPTGDFFRGKEDLKLNELLLWDNINIPGPSSALITKYSFEKSGKWDSEFSTAADQDLFFRIASEFEIGYIAETLTAYRVLNGSMSRNILLMEKDHIGVYNKSSKNRLFKNYWFKKKCFSNLYLILAGSWWVNGGSKSRGLYFVVRSILAYPPSIIKILKKF